MWHYHKITVNCRSVN